MSSALSDLTASRRDGDSFRYDVPDGWRQGRGAFGGMTIGALLRAIVARVADPRRLVRAVTAELPAPVLAGPSEIVVEILRAGNSVTTARAALVQDGEVRAHAVAVLAASRTNRAPIAWCELAPPPSPPWQQVAISPVGALDSPLPWPEFARQLEFRVLEGFPLDGGPPRSVGWIRERATGGLRDAAYVASIIDAWYPTALIPGRAFAPMATIAYTLELFDGLDGLDPAAPLLYRAAAPVGANGYFVETRELWGEDGRLVAINHQTMAILG